jgi:hypothetical protein
LDWGDHSIAAEQAMGRHRHILRPCWICGDPADSDEHRRKRSDLVARYGASWTPDQQPFVIRGDGSDRWTRIQSPNDRKNVYENMLCSPCNNKRTRPFDLSYQRFSQWILAASAILHIKDGIDFGEIYGDAYVEESLNLLRYFAKCLGCQIVEAGIEPPDGLRRILIDANRNDVKPLAVTFGINDFWRRIDPTGRIVGDDCFNNWPEYIDKPRFSWFQRLGYLDIFYWYDLEWDDGYPFGGEPMCSPRRVVSLGRSDPLPDEPEATLGQWRPSSE